MVIFRPLLWFVILFLTKISHGAVSRAPDDEERQLGKNLKILRNDFNKLIETVEDFAGDLLIQMHDAGEQLIENANIGENDYNWQDDILNTIDKTKKNGHSSLPTITKTAKTILDKTLKFPKLRLPKMPNLITKNVEEKELSNDIEKRKKRSTHIIRPQEFENRPPAPMMMQDGQMLARMPENVGHRSDPSINSEFPPFTDKSTKVREEQEQFLEDNVGQRAEVSMAPELPPFTDRTTNARGDKKGQDIFLEAPQVGQEQNPNTKDPLTCTSKSQKEMELERLKMEELKEEVKKLNEVVALLKDQQRIIKMFSEVDKQLDDNEISHKGNHENDINSSFLYRTLKQLQHNRNGTINTAQRKGDTSNMEAKSIKSDGSNTPSRSAGPTFADLEEIKIDLRITAENLNKTKAALIEEKKKEENFQHELKRQNSELKFLKVMTESLYDKMSHRFEDSKADYKMHESNKMLRNNGYEDMDVDSFLGLVHTPKTMPTTIQKYSGAPTLPEFSQKSNTRESDPGDNRGTHIHELFSRLNRPENGNKNNRVGKEINQNKQENLQNPRNKENNTNPPTNARESGSGKTDDIDIKLKVLEMLAKEGKSDDTSSKEKALNEAMKKLLEPEKPEKKSEDNELDSLMALLKKRDEPKTEKSISEENFKKILKELNAKPQSKSDDVDVGIQLRQLQKAINSLKPKEDPFLDNLNLNNLENNRKGKQEGDIQSMLSQIIAQNGGGTTPSEVDLVDTGPNLDFSTVLNANNGGSVTSGSLNLPGAGVITPHGAGKYTPQQLIQISKLMGTNQYKGGASSYNTLGGNSNPAVQQLLSRYLATSNGSPQYNNGHLNNYGSDGPSSYSGLDSYDPDVNTNSYHSYGLGADSYASGPKGYGHTSNLYGSGLNLYGPKIDPYHSNSNTYTANYQPYDSNPYGPNSYAYSLHPHGSNLYNPGPYSNPYSGSGIYGPSSGGYGSSYGPNTLDYESSTSYETPYHGQAEYGAHPPFLGPYSGSSYNSYSPEPSSNYHGETDIPHFTIPTLPTYDIRAPHYAALKNEYQQSNYASAASGGYQGSNQGTPSYHNDLGYNKNSYSESGGNNYGSGGYTSSGTSYSGPGGNNYGSGGYTSSGTSYQGSPNDYSGAMHGNKAVYGSGSEQNKAGVYQSSGNQFFPSTGSSGNIGATYHGNNYGSKGYGGPSMDQPYGNDQNGDQYKYSLASDLAKQIESLESAINGLSGHDYSQTQEDKATVASLEQRIYELKGVISSLNKPAYGTQQSSYPSKSLSYGSNSPSGASYHSQAPYKQPEQPYAAGQASYGSGSHNGGPSNSYVSPNQSPYETNTPHGQAAPHVPDHNPYSPYGASTPQSSYGASSPSQAPYANTSPPEAHNSQPYQDPKPEYPANQPNSPNYSPSPPNQQKNSPSPIYQTGPSINTHSSVAYQPSQSSSSPPYQPKAAINDDRSMLHARRKELHRIRSAGVEKSRRKRQVEGMEAQPVMSQVPPQVADADMSLNMRKNYGEGNSRVGYNIGDDAFTQIANTFKKYLEENLISNEDEQDPRQFQPANNQEDRNSAVGGLQEKLDFLKKQLESQRPSGRSLSDFFEPPSTTNHFPSTPIPYGSNNYYSNNQIKPLQITTLQHPLSEKKQDIFTQIVLKILEKLLGALPSVLHRLFGNLVSTVGDSYGDSYSPLQSVFKNLGAVGYIPLILIRLLDSAGLIIQHLGKNKFFKNFLLPGGGIAIATLFILFLVYFYQQDEPYGYISYEGNKYNKYPQYDHNSYSNNNYGATDYGNYGPYRSDSYYDSPKHRSNMPLPPVQPRYIGDLYGGNIRQVPYPRDYRTYNELDFGGKSNGGEGNVPLRYSRGYYDYFDNRLMSDQVNMPIDNTSI